MLYTPQAPYHTHPLQLLQTMAMSIDFHIFTVYTVLYCTLLYSTGCNMDISSILLVHVIPFSYKVYKLQSNLLSTLKGTPNLYFLSEVLTISTASHSIH